METTKEIYLLQECCLPNGTEMPCCLFLLKALSFAVFQLSSAWFLLDYTLNVIIVYRLGTDDFHMSYCCPVEVQ